MKKIRLGLARMLVRILIPEIHTLRVRRGFFDVDMRPSIDFMSEYYQGRKVNGVEVGVKEGRNAQNILNKLNIEKLFLIDMWQNYNGIDGKHKQVQNYAKTKQMFKDDKRIKLVIGDSYIVSQEFDDCSLDFVYIDANHNYEFVYSDIVAWFPKVKQEGFVCGHDIFNSIEVLRAVSDFCDLKKIFFNIKLPDWYIFKEKKNET